MTSKLQIAPLYLCVFLLLLVTVVPAYAGPAVVGLVAGSTNASVGGETLLPDTTLFSGDRLEVNDGVAVVALGSTSRMTFRQDTAASFLRESDEVTVFLRQGELSLFHGENNPPVRVRVGDICVVPVSGFGTLGEVAAGNGVVTVTTKDGKLRVEGNGQAIIVDKGETLTLGARANPPQAAGASSAPKLPAPPLPSTPYPSPIEMRETDANGDSLSASPIPLSSDSTVKVEASRAALDTALAGESAQVMAPATAETIEYALNPLGAHMPPSSPHKPHHIPPPGRHWPHH